MKREIGGTTEREDPLRTHLQRLLDWEDAHTGFEAIIAGIPAELRGRKPDGVPHSPWQILEHLRLAQHDILDFCRNPDYRELSFPDGYWPPTAAPPTPQAWDECVEGFRRDREAMKQLAADPKVDWFAAIPHGQGQTILREILLVADHNAYHLGQLVTVRQLLGNWPPP